MDALFVISIGCFFALFLTALAVARHLHIEAVRGAHAQEHDILRDSLESAPPRSPQQTLQTLAHKKQPDWRFLISEDAQRSHPSDSISPMMRKPPASVRVGRPKRPDWAYFNKDLGDLSDPYQPPASKAASTGTDRRR